MSEAWTQLDKLVRTHTSSSTLMTPLSPIVCVLLLDVETSTSLTLLVSP